MPIPVWLPAAVELRHTLPVLHAARAVLGAFCTTVFCLLRPSLPGKLEKQNTDNQLFIPTDYRHIHRRPAATSTERKPC